MTAFTIPGTAAELRYQTTSSGELQSLAVADKTYVRRQDETYVFEGDWLRFSEKQLGRSLVRQVVSPATTWVETYSWNESGLVNYVDGVFIERDLAGNVTRCLDSRMVWQYDYSNHQLTGIHSPNGHRYVKRDAYKRPISLSRDGRTQAFAYRPDGLRRDSPSLPSGWNVDDLGRLWTVQNPDGTIRVTFLWWGFACLARIDGPPGEPLAAIFSLDPTGTPVRMTTREARYRIPRDAFGENLCRAQSNPDLFQIHAHQEDDNRFGHPIPGTSQLKPCDTGSAAMLPTIPTAPLLPGLFGGTVCGAFFLYRSRALHPETGSFTAPDPWDGSKSDPRRQNAPPQPNPPWNYVPDAFHFYGEANAKGPQGTTYRGPLPVEKAPGGAYCVCQNDPISRMDPTGEISAGWGSFFTTLSSLTWGFQNNIVGINLLGFWNIMLSLLSFNGKTILKLGDVEAMRSTYTGSWGFRCHPSGLELLGINRHRAWTVQHTIWARGSEFEELDKARVFAPSKAFLPKLNGSLLLVKPKHGRKKTDPGFAFVLAGGRRNGIPFPQTNGFAPGWTRSGGVGKPVYDGASTPIFPEGGFHFTYQYRVPSPVEGTMAEIFPTGEVFQGQMKTRFTLRAPKFDPKPAKADVVMLTHGKDLDLFTVRAQFTEGTTEVLVTEEVPAKLQQVEAKLFKMDLDPVTENLPAGSAIDRLDAKSPPATRHHRKDDYLRLSGGAPAVVAGVQVKALEARLTLDSASPATAGAAPFKLFLASKFVKKGTLEVVSPTQLKFVAGTPKPALQDIIVLTDGATEVIHKVSALMGNDSVVPDRNVVAGLVGKKSVDWSLAKREQELGIWNGVAGVNITYTPEESGRAPSQASVIFRNKAGDLLGVRNVVARLADEIILSKNPPGGAVAHDVTAIKKGEKLSGDVITQDRLVLVPNEPAARLAKLKTATVFQVTPITAPAITNGVANNSITAGIMVFANRGWTGNRLLIPNYAGATFPLGTANTHAPMPGQLIVLQEHGTQNYELTVVKTLVKTISLAAEPAFAVGFAIPANNWQLVPIIEEGLYFQAVHKAAKEVLLLPKAYRMSAANQFDPSGPGIGTETVWMPRFKKGDLVRAIWDVGGVISLAMYRVLKQTGGYLELEGNVNIPAAPNHLAFCQMVPSSPNNGTSWAGINGKRISTGAPPAITYDFEVLHPNGIPAGMYALVNNTHVWPVEVSQNVQCHIDFHTAPAMAGKIVDVVVPQAEDNPLYSANHQAVLDEWFLQDSHLLPSANGVLIKTYQAPQAADQVQGTLSPGTVGIPNDKSDQVELDRRQALETHELQHTAQFLAQGPIVLAAIPIFLFDVIALATGEGLETAEFSAFVDGQLLTAGGSRFLRIPNPGSIDFAPERTVQVVQNSNQIKLKLGAPQNGAFSISGSNAFTDGPVAVRLERKSATEKLAKAYSWLELLTTGGLQNTLIGPLVNLLPYAIAQIVHACKGDPAGRFLQPNLFPAVIPNANNPFVIQVLPLDGNQANFAIHDILEMVANNVRDKATVVAVNGDLVSLDVPAISAGPNRELKAGKIDDGHPMHEVSNTASNFFGTTDLRWFFDPLGQLTFKKDPNDEGSLDWTLSILRAFYSTTSWSGMGFFGGFWDDIMWTTVFGEDYYSFMEQGASEMSGDLYSPVGRKRGDMEYVGDLGRYVYYHDIRNGFEHRQTATFVNDTQIRVDDGGMGDDYRINRLPYQLGDEVTLWWTKPGGGSSSKFFEITAIEKTYGAPSSLTLTLLTIPGIDSLGKIPPGMVSYTLVSGHLRNFFKGHLIRENLGDLAGVHAHDFLRVMPHRSLPGAPTASEPNQGAGSPNPSSQGLPHQLVIKSQIHPLAAPAIGPNSYQPSVLGTMPASSQLQRSRGMYVAFCQPSGDKHRITVTDGFSNQPEAGRKAQEVCGIKRQTYFFDMQVKDVKVFHGNEEVIGSLKLVYGQKANLRVEPDKNRVYQLTVSDPEHDDIARNVAAMSVLAQIKTGKTSVEIAQAYDGHTPPTHLNQPFVVPVRTMEVDVSDTLKLREEPELDAAIVNRDAVAGDTFYLILPVKPSRNDLKTVEKRTYAIAPPNGHKDPDSGMIPLSKKDLNDKVIEFIGPGRVYKVLFDKEDPPEEEVKYEWEIPIEAGQAHAPLKLAGLLKCAVTLKPHFRLLSVPANVYAMPSAAGNKLTLNVTPNTIKITDKVVITIVNNAAVNPPEWFDVKVAADKKSLEIKTNASTVPGFYKVMVTNDDNSKQKVIRTIEIT